MKRKQIIIGAIIVLCVGLGIYALIKSSHATSSPGDEEGAPAESVPSIVSVQTGALQRMTLHRYVAGYGMVEAAPATTDQPAAGAQLAAPSAGVVAKVNVVEGQHVEQGDVLMELNSGAATADYAAQEVERQKALYAQHNTSLKALQDAEGQLGLLQVVAPVSGTVTRLAVKPGEAVDVNTVVAEVVDLNRLAVSVQIPAAEATDLKTGEEVQVLTQPPATATLSFVSPAVDPKTGAVLARALLPTGSGLRPGQFIQLKIVTAVQTDCLAAPDESVVTDIKGQSVISLVKGDEATQTPVQTGFRENGWVAVAGNGLKEGDSVVTVGAYGLPDKTRIQVVNPSGDEVPTTNSGSSPGQ
ncbi:MAG TPA: efflux RND transporter periplasmic adaptor subunit [Candidatus Limnocylindrales bacterium]|nr:efflux RND transporter periplasmic adaptor subunit [Candidatus Limnocylindrales bacterium]